MKLNHDRVTWIKGGATQCPPLSRRVDRPCRLVLLGAPGVGKGTQAHLLSERFGACHLSTGDIFRAAKTLAPLEIGAPMRAALSAMQRGELVPDETVLSVIRERGRCLRCAGGFLLDGFPRTAVQAEALESLLDWERLPLTGVVNYELPLDVIVERLSGRRTCTKCQAVFHLTTMPARREGFCDHCGGSLIQREDDRPASVRVRLAAFQKSVQPLLEFYQLRGLLFNVAGEGKPETILARTLAALHGAIDAEATAVG